MILIFGALIDGAAELVAQLLIDDIDVGVEIGRQDVMGAIAVRFIALLEMACFKDQIAVLDRHPDMFARIAIAPFEQQSIFILVEAPLSIEIVAVE